MRILLKFLFILIFLLACSEKRAQKIEVDGDGQYYDLAYQFLDINKHDSSFYYFDKAKELFLEKKDSLRVANCLINMGNIQFDHGDFFGSQETVLSALNFLSKDNKTNHSLLSLAFNTIANATDELSQFEEAIKYYKLAEEYSTDPKIELKYKNNLSVSLRNAKRYNEAIALSQEILNQTSPGTRDYSKFINNLAKTKWMASNSYNPLPLYHIALKIRIKEKDLWGQNSSYASLAQYYADVNVDSAFFYSKKQFALAEQLNSPDDQLNALKRLIASDPTHQDTYSKKFIRLSDSLQTARAAAKNQFALIRYEVEKNKSDNLRLQKENTEKQNRLIIQRIATGAVILVLILVAIGGVLWYNKRRQNLELEAQNKVKETQLYLSKKIHDVVANGIYRVMTEIEYKEDIDRDGVLDKLEHMYNQSRDISHEVEQQSITETSYNEQLASLLKSFAADHRVVLIAGNDAEQWTDISKRVRDEVKHVLQELMVNMKKHSQAEQVVVRFEKSEQQFKIFYKDNGIGIPNGKSNGKGLANTVSRIESLSGEITFVNEPGKGLNITTIIPL